MLKGSFMESKLTDFLDSKDSIYHFTTKDTAMEHILNNKSLMLGSFVNTNDPKEYKSKMTSAVGWGWEDRHDLKISKVMSKIDSITKSAGFFSFCENEYKGQDIVQHGYKKSRMWSQYGYNHSGICLVFSKKLLIEELLKKSDSTTLYASTIMYQKLDESEGDILSINADELDTLELDEISFRHISNNFDKVFFNKQLDYKDENEFRIIVLSKENEVIHGTTINISKCIKMIILGDSFPKVYMPTIKSLASELNVSFKKLHWESSDYFLLSGD